MSLITLVLLAFGLATDAFAVSVSNSMCFAGISGKQQVANSACFGIFQGIMPIAGFFAGRLLGSVIMNIDHWLALILLGFIGGKMAIEGAKALRAPSDCPAGNRFGIKTMFMQAVATSIDALAVGIGFAALSVNIWLAAGIIAGITFAACLVGTVLGKGFGAIMGDWAQILGGLLLVGIGLKIFIEHMIEGI